MILYLLVPALVLGDVAIGNRTEEESGQFRMNLTFGLSTDNHSWSKPDNVTLSLYEEERARVEEELQSNTTLGVVTEDQESFQDEEDLFPGLHCQPGLLLEMGNPYCGEHFHTEMLKLSADDWCVLENVIRPYNDLTICLEKLCSVIGCFFPNPETQDFFLHIHSVYFQNCRQDEQLLEDAPHGVVVALTLIPVSLIPILVYIVVWKSKAAT